jgi:hypothetical protein
MLVGTGEKPCEPCAQGIENIGKTREALLKTRQPEKNQ